MERILKGNNSKAKEALSNSTVPSTYKMFDKWMDGLDVFYKSNNILNKKYPK